MGGDTFKPKPLEEILAPRSYNARKRVESRGRPGEPKPLWAILGEAPPYDRRPPEQGRFTGTPTSPIPMAADGNRPGVVPVRHHPPGGGQWDPVTPEVCEEKYPPWSIERLMCKIAGDSRLFNCVRSCVLEHLPEGWNPEDIDRTNIDYWIWIADHFGCLDDCDG